jgi:hypothetical protein
LWSKLEEMIRGEQLAAPDEVLRELSKKEDDLFKWAKKNDRPLFRPQQRKCWRPSQGL